MPRILLVEDDALSRDMAARRLRSRGFAVDLAGDGREALQRVDLHRPDLIVLDLGLPFLDGWEVIRRLKADPRTRDIPVVVLTAYTTPQDEARAVEAGCDAFLTKPLRFWQLLAAIEVLAPASGPAAARAEAG